jgi:hypothetical protein
MTVDRLKNALLNGIPGCLWIIRFDAKGRSEPGSSDDLAKLGESSEGYFWLHMDLTDVRARPMIGKMRGLSDAAR